MPTEIYKNWVTKATECGLSVEQTCGMAMLYAWTLTSRATEEELPDTESFWTLFSQDEFNKINQSSFNIDDFGAIAPEFQLAGELLKVKLPTDRYRDDGKAATFFDTYSQSDAKDEQHINSVLLFRHRFDMLWCQRIGECLRPEIRTPLHAYVFANSITQAFTKIDPTGFSIVLDALLKGLSPLISMFTSKKFVKELNGLEGYEPFQIALMGFMSGADPHLGGNLWEIQKVLFYKQPSGDPVNLEKQLLPMYEFLEFSIPVIENFVAVKRTSYLDLSRYIANEYIYGSISEDQFSDQLEYLLKNRYGFSVQLQNENPTQDFLMNAAAFFTVCCLKIKNLTNQIAKQPSLKMLDDRGLIWFREAQKEVTLLHEAIICFDVMISWRLGPSLGLFIRTMNDEIHRFYIGEFASNEEVENLLCKICNGYEVQECVVAFQMDNFPLKDDKPGKKFKAAFLSVPAEGETSLDLYRCDVGLEEGFFLDDYVGSMTEQNKIDHLFKTLRHCITNQPNLYTRKIIQTELIRDLGSPDAWGFAAA
jgi:hypothetical protein